MKRNKGKEDKGREKEQKRGKKELRKVAREAGWREKRGMERRRENEKEEKKENLCGGRKNTGKGNVKG